MYFKKSKFLIVGISKSGYSACSALLDLQAECYIYDDNITNNNQKLIDELCARGATLVTDEQVKHTLELVDVVILSPGVPIDNEIPISARKLKKNVIGEMELASYLINAVIIAVTGTNGKTTTCSMINHVLQCDGQRSHLLGNVGVPLSSKARKLDYDDIAVVEVSSFQLETISRFTPHVACVLNISPDHLSRHYNMENYVYLKSKLLRNLKESEYAVLNDDDTVVKEFATKTRANIIYFSLQRQVNGAYLFNDCLYWKGELIIEINKLQISGGHNLMNALATICVCKVLGICNESIALALASFKGVMHRQQEVCSINGVKYVNDSKATNPDSTINAINTINSNTILLLGGCDKGSGYERLFKQIASNEMITQVILFGQSREKLHTIATNQGVKSLSLVADFETAVKLSFLLEQKGDTILLSPACSSFDEFSGYEERGDKFIQLVRQRELQIKKDE